MTICPKCGQNPSSQTAYSRHGKVRIRYECRRCHIFWEPAKYEFKVAPLNIAKKEKIEIPVAKLKVSNKKSVKIKLSKLKLAKKKKKKEVKKYGKSKSRC